MQKLRTAFFFVHDILFSGCTDLVILLSLALYAFLSDSFSFHIQDAIIVLFLALIYVMLSTSICVHRYFSHQAFKTSRLFQFILAIIGTLGNQKGILWWSSKHRIHHKYCDTKQDPHSWQQTNLFYAWLLWTYYEWKTDWNYVPKQFKVFELILINNFHGFVKLCFMYLLYITFDLKGVLCFYYIPATISSFGILSISFNILFHPKSSNRSLIHHEKCNAVDVSTYDVLHKFPQKSRRSGIQSIDLPYYVFLKPLQLFGIIYDLK